MLLLGLSAYYHDAAAVLVEDGAPLAAVQEERLTRVRHDPAFPAGAVRAVLAQAGAGLGDVAAVAFYDKPLLKLERILETFSAYAPRGLATWVRAMPGWAKEKLLLKPVLRRELAALGLGPVPPLRFAEHHLSHAASAFYPSPFDEAAVLTIDGVGEWATASIAHGRGAGLELKRELHFPHSLGLFYSAMTYFLGFRVNSGEYKLMGLAPYGNPASPRTAAFERTIRESLMAVGDDGAVRLALQHFDFQVGATMLRDAAWAGLFGLPRRLPDQPLEQAHCDLALAAQRSTESAILAMAREARRLTGARALCLAGGVALNCVANRRLLDAGIFEDLWVQPAAGDAGGALGAALAVHHLGHGQPRQPGGTHDTMQGAFLGRAFTDAEVVRAARRRQAPFTRHATEAALCQATAARLAEGAVVGWFQGRDEWGPRALGSRSILADPRRPELQRRLNLAIKGREGFRPFAPSVLAEEAGRWFELDRPSPYMLLVAPVRGATVDVADGAGLAERLGRVRSPLPAITHVDGSARVQTVHRETNPRFAALLEAFRQVTGVGVLLDTSFNVRGEPMVHTPDQAYTCFMRTGLDALVMGDCLFEKAAQPPWPAGEASADFPED